MKKRTIVKQYVKYLGYDLRTKQAKTLVQQMQKAVKNLRKKITVKQYVKSKGYDLRTKKAKNIIKSLNQELKQSNAKIKVKAPKITISKNKKKTISILKKYAEEISKAIRYNEKNIGSSNLLKKHKSDILRPQKARLEELNRAIADIEKSKIKPTAKDLAVFRQAFARPVFKIESAYSQEALVYDRDTNFRNMVLSQLQADGVDIYDPAELNKVLKGNDILDLVEFIEVDEGENWYRYLQTGAVTTIKDLVAKKEAYENSLRKKYHIPKDWMVI